MIGIGKNLLYNGKRLIEIQQLLFHQDAQQLGNRHRGMGVIQLDGIGFREMGKIMSPAIAVLPHQGVKRSGHKEILLLQAQAAALVGVVIGVQHVRDGLGHVAVGKALAVFLAVEMCQIHFVHGLRLPQAQGINGFSAPADDRHIIGNSPDSLIFKMDLDALVLPTDAPRIAKAQPVIRDFTLKPIFKVLFEKAIAVADAKAVQRQIQRSRTVQETRCQPAQTAVAQRVVLNFLQRMQGKTVVFAEFICLLEQPQIQQVAEYQATHQKFGGQIAGDAFGLFLSPNGLQFAHGGFTDRGIQFFCCGCFRCFTEISRQNLGNSGLKRCHWKHSFHNAA